MSVEFETILDDLRAKGHRITLPRRWTLKVLCDAGGHMTSEDVYQHLMQHSIQVDEATVYRTLQWLADNRIVTRTNLGFGADVFSLYHEPHHHLICVNCRQIHEVEDSLFESLREQIHQQYDFTPQMDHYAIFGLCRQCRDSNRNPHL
jgi:Fur family ferric uptake transcriptional regulator